MAHMFIFAATFPPAIFDLLQYHSAGPHCKEAFVLKDPFSMFMIIGGGVFLRMTVEKFLEAGNSSPIRAFPIEQKGMQNHRLNTEL